MANEFDVIVAGFGAAGAAAAVTASEAGARVLVLDRAPESHRGGNTRNNLFYMRMKDAETLAEDFVSGLREISAPWGADDLTASELSAPNQWSLDSHFLTAWSEQAVPTVGWLRDLGLEFSHQESDIGGPSGVVPHGGGRHLLSLLEERARAAGATFRYESALVDLRLDNKGKVEACVVESSDGRYDVPCSSVILATGGFQGNRSMLIQHMGSKAKYMEPMVNTSLFNHGEGLTLGHRIGADTVGYLYEWHALAMDARARGERWIFTGVDLGIMVNSSGERFFDETLGEAPVKAIAEEDGGRAWVIVDSSSSTRDDYGRRFNSGKEPIRAETLAELAALIDVPTHTLERTVADYNAYCDDGRSAADPSTGRVQPPRSDGGRSLSSPPFEAWPVRQSVCFSLGGLRIDEHGRVLSPDRRPIVGLYAAGDVAGGYYRKYLSYTSSIKAVVFGRLSGAHAANRAIDSLVLKSNEESAS